jgi:hypothetical protein
MRKLLTAITAALLVLMSLAASAGGQPYKPSALGTPGGAIVVVDHSVRPLPANTTELRFTGLSADQTQTFFSISRPPRRHILLSNVSLEVKILKIEYFAGSILVGLFEGFVQVNAAGRTLVRDPSWTTQPPCHTPAPDENGEFGADLEKFDQKTVPLALPPRALKGTRMPSGPPVLPARVTLDDLPPVGMQGTINSLGSPGSCIAWSFGYGLGSYTADHNPDGTLRRDPHRAHNQVSPAFLYPLIHSQEGKLCPQGSGAGYLPQLVLQGAPSMAQVPYAPDCCYLNDMNLNQQFPREDKFRIGSFANIPLPLTSGADRTVTLALLKEFLAAGMPVAFAGFVFHNFASLPLDDGVFYAPDGWCTSSPTKPCGHGMLLVGYDDTLGDPGQGLGAFLVQNSFGVNWPVGGASPAAPGQFYLSYNIFLDSQRSAQVAYPLDRNGLKKPQLAATPAGGPQASIPFAYQWTDSAVLPRSYLILLHRFSQPVEIESVTLTEPTPSTAHVTQLNGYPLSNGYTYLVRNDGKSWLSGDYTVTINAQDVSGRSFTYTGVVSVSVEGSSVLPAATMPDQVVGTTGQTFPVQR